MRALKKKPIQVYIEPDQDRALEVMSRRKGTSKAAIIRLSLSHYLTMTPVEEDPALGLVGLGKSGKGDLAERHDHYLARYSARKKRR
ncbi:MAG: ribbon-helix-helix domain-containing protein [Nitrospirae bacterium]|nr:ribbon-helix-helix domain-containing protein [Nitrospirota bacterium]